MEQKIEQLARHKLMVLNFSINTRKTKKDKQTKGFLTSRQNLLSQYWDKYVALYEKVLAADKSDAAVKAYLADDDYDTVERTYAETMGELSDLIEDLLTSHRSAVNTNTTQHDQPTPVAPLTNLPRIKIPPFNGTYSQWYPFKDIFNSIVTANNSLTNTQRLQYLKDSLTGDARHALDNITTTEDNFKIAWELLERKYDNKRIIINAHLTEITNLTPISRECATKLRTLLDGISSSVRALEQLQRPVQHWDDWLVFITTQKLDPSTRKAWELSLKTNSEIPTYQELCSFLECRTQSLEMIQCFGELKPDQKLQSQSTPKRVQPVRGYHTTTIRCPACSGKHLLMFCNEFRKRSPNDRFQFIEQAHLCINCLRSGHNLKNCLSQRRCQKCNNLHHTILHEHFEKSNNTDAAPSTLSATAPVSSHTTLLVNNCTVNSIIQLPAVLLGTALVEVRSKTGHSLILRALLDSGAEATFISEYAAQRLQLPRTAAQIPINGAGGSKIATAESIVQFTLHSTKSTFKRECVALVLPRVGNLSPSVKIPSEHFKNFWQLDLADPQLNTPGKIDLILNAADYASAILSECKRCTTTNLIAQNTQLGWILFGGLQSSSKINIDSNYDCYFTRVDLDQTLRKFWEIEEVSLQSTLTKDENYCLDFFKSTTKRLPDGRYSVRLPIKENADLSELKSTFSEAVALLPHLEKRLQRDSKLHDLYHQFLDEYLALGHMEVVADQHSSQIASYLPHHGVLKESSTTTKLRVVFNASKKGCTGISLNDCLHVGPKLQNDLTSIMLNWRRYRIAFTGDIEKMYRQIFIDSQDADLQRIIWRKSIQDEPNIYRLLTVTYGTNCAPFLAINVLRTLAQDEKERFPNASQTLLNEFYVDDVLSGADTVSSAFEKRKDLQALLKAGGFSLRKFNSNSTEVLQDIHPNEREFTGSCELKLDGETKALGIIWQTHTDTLGYKIHLNYDLNVFSKRQLLSDVAKLFDPLGLLAPVVIRCKLLFQQLWPLNLGWNDLLPGTLQEQWMTFREDLQHLQDRQVPRWINTSLQAETYELHSFADASTLAYAAVVYLKVTTPLKTHISLLLAKTKVAPLKKVTIPRLELCAALMAAKLVKRVQDTLQLNNVVTYLWSDSTTTLCWIHSSPGKLKEFVANRVGEIQQLTSTDDWRYVPTAHNPADCASRGLSAVQLKDYELWWHGPEWLIYTESHWPTIPLQVPDEIPEMRPIQVLSIQISKPDWFIMENYSSLDRLLAVTAWCQRFIAKMLRKPSETETFCLWNERYTALKSWTKRVQNYAFKLEVSTLTLHQAISKRSKLLKLNPFIDSEGILRIGGRLTNANIAYNECHPMILPKDNHFTDLVIRHAHHKTQHGGTQITLQHIRRQFWIIDGRTAVKRIIRNCVKCFRQSAQPCTQLMGNLPAVRCSNAHPFMHSGVDYAGPFHIRMAKGRGYRSHKGYVVLFVCLATKAINLELVSDMTSEAFLAALNRFVSVRGLCSDLYSDRGTTFVGADALMKDELQAFHTQLNAAAVHASQIGINWHFIPAGAPTFGGLWEAGVKSMKFHLKRVINNSTLTFEEFYTVLKQIEGALNSRPISSLTDDPSDLSALTPGHFLIGRALLAVPEQQLLDININRLTRWKQIRQMHQDFWRRWSCEYLHQLQKRNKWHKTSKNIAIGQLVLIRDERYPPAQWALGRVIDTHTGEDGLIRVVTLKTSSTTLKRPITKVSLLPIEDNSKDSDEFNTRSSHSTAVEDGGRSVSEISSQRSGRGGRNVQNSMHQP